MSLGFVSRSIRVPAHFGHGLGVAFGGRSGTLAQSSWSAPMDARLSGAGRRTETVVQERGEIVSMPRRRQGIGRRVSAFWDRGCFRSAHPGRCNTRDTSTADARYAEDRPLQLTGRDTRGIAAVSAIGGTLRPVKDFAAAGPDVATRPRCRVERSRRSRSTHHPLASRVRTTGYRRRCRLRRWTSDSCPGSRMHPGCEPRC